MASIPSSPPSAAFHAHDFLSRLEHVRPTPQEARQLAVERDQRSSAIRRLHWLHSQGCDELHEIQAQIENLGACLVYMPGSPEADALTHELHDLLDRERRLDSILQMVEGGMRPRRF